MEIFNKVSIKQLRKDLRKNSTRAEQFLWEYLRNKKLCNKKFKRQYSVDKYILDFYCPEHKLGIELDGEVHLLADAKSYDDARTKILNSLGIKILRIKNEEVFENINLVLEKIKNHFT